MTGVFRILAVLSLIVVYARAARPVVAGAAEGEATTISSSSSVGRRALLQQELEVRV
jgi:hypothetical protein